MEMTKQRKMLIGVLCLGIGGLAVDRFVIGMPDEASASDEVVAVVEDAPPALQPRVAEQAQPQPQANDASAKALPSYAGLTERLIQAQQQEPAQATAQRDDPFALPDQWQSDRSTAPQSTDPKASSRQQVQLNKLFKLDGTVRSEINGKEEMLAVISGGGLDSRAIRVDQLLAIPYDNGTAQRYELVEVGPRYAVWKLLPEGPRVVMRVEEDL